MSKIEIFFLALSLSMDCFAVSVSSGGTMKYLNIKHWLKLSFFFGFFQGLMPIIGWAAGITILEHIKQIDHWVAFGLLFLIGSKMIYESLKLKEYNCMENKACPFQTHTVLILSIATSIDALAIGITFSIVNIPILFPVVLIGIVSFLMSILGVYLGYRGGKIFENKMELIAGIILIFLGGKILLSHIFA